MLIVVPSTSNSLKLVRALTNLNNFWIFLDFLSRQLHPLSPAMIGCGDDEHGNKDKKRREGLAIYWLLFSDKKKHKKSRKVFSALLKPPTYVKLRMLMVQWQKLLAKLALGGQVSPLTIKKAIVLCLWNESSMNSYKRMIQYVVAKAQPCYVPNLGQDSISV